MCNDGAADVAAKQLAQQDLSGDYGPTVSSGRHSRLHRGRSTIRGTTGQTDLQEGYAGVHRSKRTTRPRDLPGVGRRLSPMLGIWSKATSLLTDGARAW
jgi:hypothetical protein